MFIDNCQLFFTNKIMIYLYWQSLWRGVHSTGSCNNHLSNQF